MFGVIPGIVHPLQPAESQFMSSAVISTRFSGLPAACEASSTQADKRTGRSGKLMVPGCSGFPRGGKREDAEARNRTASKRKAATGTLVPVTVLGESGLTGEPGLRGR